MRTQVPVAELVIGAFIQELDLPWLDTPFLLQGFVLENDDDLLTLRSYCQYVVVDPERSVGEAKMLYAVPASQRPKPGPAPRAAAPQQLEVYAVESDSMRAARESASILKDLSTVMQGVARPPSIAESTRPAGGSGLVVSADHGSDPRARPRPAPAAGERKPAAYGQGARAGASDTDDEAILAHADEEPAGRRRGLLGKIVDTFRAPTVKPARPERQRSRSEDLAEQSPTLMTVENNVVVPSQQLVQAQAVHESARAHIHSVIEDLQRGGRVDVEQLSRAVEDMVETVSNSPEAMMWVTKLKKKDNYTYDHGLDSAIYLSAFGRHLGFPKYDLQQLALSGMLFDVGKLRTPEELLKRPGKLNTREFDEVKRHVEHGIDMLAGTAGISTTVLEIVAQHHERHDGSGYPIGLAANEISLFARMAGIVDCFEAMTSARPYADAIPPHQALRALHQWRDLSFAGALIDQFLQCIGVFPVGTLVELNTGEVGIVIAQNRIRRLQPKIMILLDEHKQPHRFPGVIDLLTNPMVREDVPYSIARDLPVGSYGIDGGEFFLNAG